MVSNRRLGRDDNKESGVNASPPRNDSKHTTEFFAAASYNFVAAIHPSPWLLDNRGGNYRTLNHHGLLVVSLAKREKAIVVAGGRVVANETRPKPRRWLRFSLRAFLALITVLAI